MDKEKQNLVFNKKGVQVLSSSPSRTTFNSNSSHVLKPNVKSSPSRQSPSYTKIPTDDDEIQENSEDQYWDPVSYNTFPTGLSNRNKTGEYNLHDGIVSENVPAKKSGKGLTQDEILKEKSVFGKRSSSDTQQNVHEIGINNSYDPDEDDDDDNNIRESKRRDENPRANSIGSPQDFEEKSQFEESYGPQFYAALAANLGSMALGSVLSWTSPALPDLRARKTIGEITDVEETWISSIALLGATAACPIIGLVMERFGRRKCMLLLTTPFVLGWILITFAQNLWMMYLGRFLTGFCGGGCSIAVPVYITETSSAKIRGMLASGFDMLITVGILYIFIIGTYVSWQYQAVACGLIPIIFHLLMMFAPESPRYLVERGNHVEANKALCWLRGAKSSSQIQPEMDELVKSVDESKEKSASFRELVTNKSIFKPTLIAVILMVFQQLAAIDAVMFYTVDIFRASGTDIDENLSANIVGGVQVLATVTAAVFVDHCGRRFLLIVSEIGMVISLAAMGTFFYLKKENNDQVPENLGWLPLASLMVLCIAFSVGMGPLPWLLMGELLPPHVKGLASGLVTITRWILGFLVTIAFKGVMENLGMHGGYWLFSGCCFVGLIFIYFWVPETSNKTLDEIQKFFEPKTLPLPPLNIEASLPSLTASKA